MAGYSKWKYVHIQGKDRWCLILAVGRKIQGVPVKIIGDAVVTTPV
jgi:hypothetical protein